MIEIRQIRTFIIFNMNIYIEENGCYFNTIARSFILEERNLQFPPLNYAICISDRHDQINKMR